MRHLKNNSEKKGDDVDNDNEAKKGLRLKAGCWSRFSTRPLRFHNYLGSRKWNSVLTSVWCFCYGITGMSEKNCPFMFSVPTAIKTLPVFSTWYPVF